MKIEVTGRTVWWSTIAVILFAFASYLVFEANRYEVVSVSGWMRPAKIVKVDKYTGEVKTLKTFD